MFSFLAYPAVSTDLDEVEREAVAAEEGQDGVERLHGVVTQGYDTVCQNHERAQKMARQQLQGEDAVLQTGMDSKRKKQKCFCYCRKRTKTAYETNREGRA